jgi:hypothetical protein
MKKYCPEESMKDQYPGSKSLVKLDNDQDEVILPHVDSCVALVYKLSSGRIYCAHVSQGKGNSMDLDGAWSNMQVALKTKFGNHKVTSLYAIGASNWAPRVCALMKTLFTEEGLEPDEQTWWHKNDGQKDGVDVTVKYTGAIEVTDCKSKQRLSSLDGQLA